MYASYAARLPDGRLLSLYHTGENGISQKIYENGRWSRALSLAVDARPEFSAAMDEGGGIYIIYRDRNRALKFCAGGEKGYESKNIDGLDEKDGSFHISPSAGGLMLIYETETSDIMVLKLSKGGTRSTPEPLGRCLPCAEGGFRAQTVRGDHSILFYQVKNPDGYQSFGYREITTDKTGVFNAIHITAGSVMGYSCLTTEDAIHFLYIVRNAFSYQLIYRKRHGGGLMGAAVVCESRRIDGCMMFIIRNRIYACAMTGGVLYTSLSGDDGQSFSRPARYRSKLCEKLVKAGYISAEPPKEDAFAAREVYTDALNPWDIQAIPDLYDDFYPFVVSGKQPQNDTPEVKNESEPPVRHTAKPTEAELYYGSDLSEEAKLRNQLEMMERRLAEKDRQIISYSVLKQEVETQRSVIERLYKEKEEYEKLRLPAIIPPKD